MMKFEELVASISVLRREDLEQWIGESMIRPREQQGESVFEEAECVRVELICSLYYDMEIETETLPVVLDLIDQLHQTRQRLRALGDAVLAQDEEVRRAILNRLEPRNTH